MPVWFFACQCKVICEDPFLDLFITICILLNTLFLAADHRPIEPSVLATLDIANTVSKTTLLPHILFFKLIRVFKGIYDHIYRGDGCESNRHASVQLFPTSVECV